nr:hypothetical protein CFP56_23078 [Quercus suber]
MVCVNVAPVKIRTFYMQFGAARGCCGTPSRISNGARLPPPSPLVAHPAHWLPHSLHQYKANCDGAVFRDINSAGLGVVIRDSVGLLIAALSERICLPSTVDELEALACRRVVAFALQIGLHEVAFEGDSEVVFKQLNAEPPCLASYGHIIEESQILALNLSFASFSHVKVVEM